MKCLRSYRRSIAQSVQVTSEIPVLIRLRGAMFWHVIAVGLMIATLAATGAIAQPVLVTKLLPQAVYGQPYHADLMIGGDSPPDVATIAGLPPGLSAMHNGRGSVVIAGIPAAQGTHALALHASNGAGELDVALTLDVARYSQDVTSISAGNFGTCGVVHGGALCWGNSPEPRKLRFKIPTGSGVTVVVASPSSHFCAVARGGVSCWGSPSYGSVGLDTNTFVTTPFQVIPEGAGATTVAAGDFFTCAVVNGGVKCWGRNYYGQLGDGTTVDHAAPSVAVPEGTGVTTVSAGAEHACAVANGGLLCWGNSRYGELGNGTHTASAIPVEIFAPRSGVTAVSAGAARTCAIVQGGVRCWGSNAIGIFGGVPDVDQLVPTPIASLSAGATAVSVSPSSHICAVVNSRLYCWGYNSYGQLGDGSTSPSSVPIEVALEDSGFVTDIATGSSHTCSIVRGAIRCWGDNYFYALGNSIETIRTLPEQVIAAGGGATYIASSSTRSCAVVTGGVQCWGDNTYGQLGDGSTRMSVRPVWAIPASSGATTVAIGEYHACSTVAGGVKCWGVPGGLGVGSLDLSPLTAVQTIPANSGVVAVTIGEHHTCALVLGGVKCWGYNSAYRFGATPLGENQLPVEVLPANSGVDRLVAGSRHTCVVISGGAKCWGENIGGQLGTGDTNDTTAVSEVFPVGSGITSISAGLFSTCVTKTGGIWCWGTNHAGELGWGNAGSSFTPVEVLPAGSGATLVAQGFANACAVVLGGTRCWGDNSFGQLGNGSTVGALSPIITLSSQSGVSQVAVGASRSCALVNGGVACWGLESRVAIIGNPSPYRKAYAATPHVDSANALDIDGSLVGAHRYSATVDGTLVLRYLRDPTLLPLPLNLAASESLRTTASDLRDYLDTVRYLLDVDGDGSYDTKVDGVLVIRYLLGFRGAALTVGIFSQSSPLSPRTTPAAIEEYLGNLTR